MKFLEEQIKGKIEELINRLANSDENDKEIIDQIYELKKILDFRIQQPEE